MGKEVGKDVPIILAGNMADLVDSRQVSTKEGEEMAKEMGATFIEVSAKTGLGVQQLFEEIAHRCAGLYVGPQVLVTVSKEEAEIVFSTISGREVVRVPCQQPPPSIGDIRSVTAQSMSVDLGAVQLITSTGELLHGVSSDWFDAVAPAMAQDLPHPVAIGARASSDVFDMAPPAVKNSSEHEDGNSPKRCRF